MTRQDIEEYLLLLMAQEPVSMSRNTSLLSCELFSGERRLLFEALSVIQPADMDVVVVQSALKNVNPATYGGTMMLDRLFTKSVVFKQSKAASLIDSLYEENARDKCKDVAYGLLEVRNDPSANVFAAMDAARMELIPRVSGSTERSTDDIFSDILSKERAKSFVLSHITNLDNHMKGWEPGEVIVLAGSPSMGKTSVALHVFAENVLTDVPVGFFSLEMTDTMLMQRVASMKLEIENTLLRSRNLDDVQLRRMEDLKKLFKSKRFFINYKERQCSRIINIMRSRVAEGYKLFIVDYLQLMSQPNKNGREQEIATMSRMIKEAAAELDCVIMPLSQLSREHTKRADKRPQLSDLRESGSIEQDADAVIFPYRSNYFNFNTTISSDFEPIEFIIAKGRSTGTGTVHAQWEGKYTKIH